MLFSRSCFARSACVLALTQRAGLYFRREYPQNDDEAWRYVELLKVCREELDKLARGKDEGSTEKGYELTIAAVSPEHGFDAPFSTFVLFPPSERGLSSLAYPAAFLNSHAELRTMRS